MCGQLSRFFKASTLFYAPWALAGNGLLPAPVAVHNNCDMLEAVFSTILYILFFVLCFQQFSPFSYAVFSILFLLSVFYCMVAPSKITGV
jgi:hypothetical protein